MEMGSEAWEGWGYGSALALAPGCGAGIGGKCRIRKPSVLAAAKAG